LAGIGQLEVHKKLCLYLHQF